MSKPLTSQWANFIQSNLLNPESVDSDALLVDFKKQMDLGRKQEQSSLAMLNAHILVKNKTTYSQPIIVLDAGGSNCRVSLVEFKDKKSPLITYFEKYEMPGKKAELSKSEFFETLFNYLKPVLNKSDRIGFCFSYPCEIFPDQDGKLLYWTKEIKAKEVEGEALGKNLNAIFIKNNFAEKDIVILNDTVATLLAASEQSHKEGSSMKADGHVGFILGTGTNCAFSDPNCGSIVNIESGAFNGFKGGELDRDFDQSCVNPNEYIFEKKISGRYLGPLFSAGLKMAAKQKLFSEDGNKVLENIKELSTSEANDILKNKNFKILNLTKTEDQAFALNLILNISQRAAKLSAVNIAAAAIASQGGQEANTFVSINIDGSTYYKLHGFRKACELELDKILKQKQVAYELRHTDNAPTIGSAIAAKMA